MKPHPRTTLRLLGCALALTAAGCVNTAREQDGDADIESKLATYVVTVSPPTVTLTQSEGIAIVPFTVSGACTGLFDPAACLFRPGWRGFEYPTSSDGIDVTFDSEELHSTLGNIKVNVPLVYLALGLPNGIQGGTGSLGVTIDPSAGLPPDLVLRGGDITLTIQAPGSPPARPENSPDEAALAAPGKLTLKPASGATTITLPCPVTYTGPATRLLPGTFSGPDAARFSGGVFSGDIGGDHGNNEDGFVTFTLPPAPGPFAYSATLTISTENGASTTVALKGLRP